MKFYFDENLSRYICYALNQIELRDGHNECIFIPDYFKTEENPSGKGISDEVIMDVLSKEKAVYVTEDDDLKKITLKYNLSKQKNIGVILFKKPSKNVDYWLIVNSFFKHWLTLRKKARKTKMPFFIKFTPKSIEEL